MQEPQWCVRYTDIFGKEKVKSFTEKNDAQECYESLLSRTYGGLGDIVRVSPPVQDVVEAVLPEMDWGDFESVMRDRLVGDESTASGSNYYFHDDKLYTKGGDGPLLGVDTDYSSDNRGDVFVYNLGIDSETYKKVRSIVSPLERDIESAMSGDFDYPVYLHIFDSEENYLKYLKDMDEDCGSSAASLGAVPTGGSRMTRTDDESVVRTRRYGK